MKLSRASSTRYIQGMNSSLVPQQRPDKNGKITTRWVKPEDANSKSAAPLPSPALSFNHEISRETLLIAASELYARAVRNDNVSFDEHFQTTYAELDAFSTQTISLINDLKGKEWRCEAIRDFLQNQETEEFVVDFLELSDHLEHTTEAADECTSYVRALRHYPSLHPHTAGDIYPQERLDQCRGLISATAYIEEMISEDELPDDAIEHIAHDYDFEPAPLIRDRRITDLIIARPDDAQRIADFINERKTLDYGLIVEWLDETTPAVSSGLL